MGDKLAIVESGPRPPAGAPGSSAILASTHTAEAPSADADDYTSPLVGPEPVPEPVAVAPVVVVAAVAEAPAAKPKARGFARLVELLPRGLFALMHVGAIVLPFYAPLTGTAFALFLGLYILRGFGLTAGFHRYFAHRAYQTGRVFQFMLGWFGAMAVQRGPMWWAGHHRHHHKYSDLEGDPHSPIVDSVWWSHLGWIVSDDLKDADKEVMKDWHKYPELWWLDKYDWVPGTLTAVFCYLVGGFSGFVWGFLFGTVLLYHSTFLVNSMCHLLGTRRFETTDRSRNNFFVAFMTMGEGWHNNHHHYPSAARQGFKWWEFDASYTILKVLSVFGIVWGLRQPTPRALQSKLIRK